MYFYLSDLYFKKLLVIPYALSLSGYSYFFDY